MFGDGLRNFVMRIMPYLGAKWFWDRSHPQMVERLVPESFEKHSGFSQYRKKYIKIIENI